MKCSNCNKEINHYKIIVEGFNETNISANNEEEALKKYFETLKEDIEVRLIN